MLLPIGDDNRDRRIIPTVNYLLIALNVFVFIYWQHFGFNDKFTYAFATVPGEILTNTDIITRSKEMVDPYTSQQFHLPGLQLTPVPVFLTLITSLFLHGGIAHLAGNMLFLGIFGDNLENVMGHFRYLIFYLLCGILSGLSHVVSTFIFGQNLLLPCLGASGAISGVMGGYLLLFPMRRVKIWAFIFFVFSIPAFLVVGLWFVFQVLNAYGSLGGEEAGGIAYAAHIGGFIFGLLLVRRFAKPALLTQRRSQGTYYRRFH